MDFKILTECSFDKEVTLEQKQHLKRMAAIDIIQNLDSDDLEKLFYFKFEYFHNQPKLKAGFNAVYFKTTI